MNWDDVRYFIAVAEQGSLSAAGRHLRVNPATVGRHIDSLEDRLDVRLFDRRKDGYTLTQAGEKMLDRAQSIENEFFALKRVFDAEDRDLVGTVTVTATESLTKPFLIQNLPMLYARHPGIRMHLVNEYRSLNLSRREADVAIRLARPEQGDLVIRKIGEMGYGLYASKSYLEKRGVPEKLGDLRSHDMIDWLEDFPEVGSVSWLRRHAGSKPPIFSTNEASGRIAAVRAGIGIALVPCMMASMEPSLVRVLGHENNPFLDLWLLAHRDLARIARVRATLDFIAERAREEADFISGRV